MNKKVNSKILLFLSVLLIFVLVLGSASAAENTDEIVNETLTTSSDEDVNTIDEVSAADTQVVGSADVLSASGNNFLSAGEKTWTDLKNEIESSSSNIKLTSKYYKYSSGDTVISVSNKVIDGDGAVIDGAGKTYPFKSNGNITFKNIIFTNMNTNQAGSGDKNFVGGVIWFSQGSSNIIFDNVEFTNIKETVSGRPGVLSFPDGNNITINNCNFNNISSYNANIFIGYSQYNTTYMSDNVRITNCKFTNNTATNANGFLYAARFNNFLMENCTISYNNFRGTAFNFNGGNNIIIKNNEFSHISSSVGTTRVIYIGTNVNNHLYNFSMSYCNFTDMVRGGLGIASNTGYYYNIYIGNCIFENLNFAGPGPALNLQGQNGATYLKEAGYNVTVEYCIFNNLESTSGSSVGGAFELKSINNLLQYCSFNNTRTAGRGGAIAFYSNTQNTTIQYCNFTNTHAGSYGGALSANAAGCINTNILYCNFNNCTSNSYGGALVFYGANSTISNCNFTYNSATDMGGAIIFNAENGKISYCNFVNNTGREGGAVKFSGLNGYMGFSNYVNNTATVDGGALCSEAQGSTVENCTFTNNSAPQGNDFYAHGNNTIRFIGLMFQTLYLTNSNATYTVSDGYGTWYNRPAAWIDQADFLDSFLDTSHGQATI